VGTDKRERQKQARQAKIEQESAAAKKQRTFRTVRNVVIVAAVVLGGAFAYSSLAGGDDDEPDEVTEAEGDTTTLPEAPTTTIDPEVESAVQERGKPDPAPPPADTAADAVEVETLAEGEGEGAEAGDSLVIEYVGKTADGNVFDFSWENHDPIPVTLGTGGVIPGWEEGLLGVKLGERRRMVIGSDMAYGAEGSPPDIPPNAPLVFEVDVISLTPAAG
jgi:peptidylprolyl isomerase